MYHIIKPLVGVLIVAGVCSTASAASLGYVDHLGYGAYLSATDGAFENESLLDLSTPPSSVAYFGANYFDTAVGGGSLSHSYAADAVVDFSGAQTPLWMSMSQSLQTQAGGAFSVASHQQDVVVDVSALNMRILGDAGETAVVVSFTGTASALADFSSVASGGYLTMGLSVSRGAEVLGEYLWDVQAGGDQNIQFSFGGNVGDDLTLSAFILSGAGLHNASFDASASSMTLVEGFGAMNGSFAVAAVPEPEAVAMMLAGLGLISVQLRRRSRRQQAGCSGRGRGRIEG
jgi:hypothetical protein